MIDHTPSADTLREWARQGELSRETLRQTRREFLATGLSWPQFCRQRAGDTRVLRMGDGNDGREGEV